MARFVVIMLLLLSWQTSHAEWIGGTDGVSVSMLQINDQGSVRIFTPEGIWATALCPGYPNPSNVLLDFGHAGFTAVYSALLTAKASGKKIRIFSTQCIANTPAVETIQLLD